MTATAIVFDVDDVLVDSRREFFVTAYNIYRGFDENRFVQSFGEVPPEFIGKYKKPDRWANQIKHRLACNHCVRHDLVPTDRSAFETIMARFSVAQIRDVENRVAAIRDLLRRDPDRYYAMVRPFAGIPELVRDLGRMADIFVCTANPKAVPVVHRYFPQIDPGRIYTKDHGSKPENIAEIIARGYEAANVHFVDDNFTNVIDVVATPGLEAVNGYVNDWGESFTRAELEAEPSIRTCKGKIRIVSLDELRRILLGD